MSIDRTVIIKGPAKIVHDTATYFSEADITVNWITEYFDVATSAFGRLGRRVQSRRIEVTFIPKVWDNLTKMFPYASAQIGDPIFGATDKTLVITPRNGAPLTLSNAAVSQLPGITLSAGKALLREMKFTALCAKDSDPSDASKWFAFGTAASNAALTGFDRSKVYNSRYSLAWNSGTFRAEEGFDLDFTLGLQPDNVDGEGIVNYRISELEVSLKFKPVGGTEEIFAGLLGWDGVDTGGDPATDDAVLTGEASGAPIITLAGMQVQTGAAGYGSVLNRFGEVELMSVRQIDSDLLGALWTFEAAD
jgi:hypothetical protein